MLILKDLEEKYNSNPRESERLLKLCNNDLKELNILYLKIRLLGYNFKTPSNEEEYKVFKNTSLELLHSTGLKGEVNTDYGLIYIGKIAYIACTWKSGQKLPLTYFWQSIEEVNFIEKEKIIKL